MNCFPAIVSISEILARESFFELTGRPIRTAPVVGVNLVGYFEGLDGARSFASTIANALTTSGIPHVEISLDQDLPDQETCRRFRHHTGALYRLPLA